MPYDTIATDKYIDLVHAKTYATLLLRTSILRSLSQPLHIHKPLQAKLIHSP